MSPWNGEERRSPTSDHDLLNRIDIKLDILVGEFQSHKEEDQRNFTLLNRFMYGVTGGLILFEIITRFFK